jgi:hypothetical protein
MTIVFEFEWELDEDGYDLLPAGKEPEGPGPFFVSLHPPIGVGRRFSEADAVNEGPTPAERPDPKSFVAAYDRIARRGGRLLATRPLEVPDLYMVFAYSAKTKEGLLDFVRRYGPLTHGYHGRYGENVQDGLDMAREMHQLLACPVDRRAAALTDESIRCAYAEVFLTANAATKSPQITYKVHSLRDALWLQFADALSGGTSVRMCKLCGTFFKVGPGTGRREDAQFCSDPHRIAYNSKKRGKQHAEGPR